MMIRIPVAHDEGNLGTPVRVLLDAQPDIIVINTEYVAGQVLPIADELHARVPTCALLLRWLFQSSLDGSRKCGSCARHSFALRCAGEPVRVISGVY